MLAECQGSLSGGGSGGSGGGYVFLLHGMVRMVRTCGGGAWWRGMAHCGAAHGAWRRAWQRRRMRATRREDDAMKRKWREGGGGARGI